MACARRSSSAERLKGSSSSWLSAGPKNTKGSPGAEKVCRSTSTSWLARIGPSRVAMRSSTFSGDRLGRKSRFRLRSPSRRPAAQATGLATGTKVRVPRCRMRRPSANSARICRMAMGPAVSLPCTPPITSRRGPGRSAWYWWTSMTREALGLVGLVALVSESAMVNRVGIVKRTRRILGVAVRPDVPGVSDPGASMKRTWTRLPEPGQGGRRT